MLNQISSKELAKAVEKKGFTLESESNDKFYRLYYRGRKTGVFTKVSHGQMTYSRNNGMLGAVRRQLQLRTNMELSDFLECPLSYEDYIRILLERNIIGNE